MDDLVINHLYQEDEEEKEKSVRDEINQVTSQCLDYYIEKMNVNNKRSDWKPSRYHNFVERALKEITIDVLKNNGNWKDMVQDLLNPEELLFSLIGGDRYTYRACKNHEDSLLNNLRGT
ncbi:MAG: hypothetical protein QW046_03640 [Candidatus Micrarchaeaceae archaeon]